MQQLARYSEGMTKTLSSGACTATLIRPPGVPRTRGPRRIVAVSGGIGSGKSSVTRVFASKGAVIADADAIAREILEPGEPALDEVARAFGDDLIGDDGSLDRALLAARAPSRSTISRSSSKETRRIASTRSSLWMRPSRRASSVWRAGEWPPRTRVYASAPRPRRRSAVPSLPSGSTTRAASPTSRRSQASSTSVG